MTGDPLSCKWFSADSLWKSGLAPLFYVFKPLLAGCMDRQAIEAILDEKLRPVIEAEGVELFEIEVLKQGRRDFLRIYLDRPDDGGVSLEDCSRVSRRIGPLIEATNLFEGRYVLEVSSPGVTRALKKDRDFVRFVGKLARISAAEPIGEKNQWIGDLAGMDGADVLIRPLEGDGVVRIPKGLIRTARLEYEPPAAREARQKKLGREA